MTQIIIGKPLRNRCLLLCCAFPSLMFPRPCSEVKLGNTGARGPRQKQHFQQQRAPDFSTLAVFCEHRYFENGQEMPWRQGPKHTFNGICRGFCAQSFLKLYFFWEELLLWSMFQFRGQQLEQVLVDIVLSPYILICLAEQLWVGQAIDACLHTATNEAFASCPQLINLLRSSNSTLSSLLLSSHFASELRATVFDLFNSWGNISTHVPRKVHIYINTYVTSCTCTRRKHINSCATKSAQHFNRMSLHVHEPSASMSTHVPRRVHSISTCMSLPVHEPEGNISTHVPRKVHSVSKCISLHVHEP